MSDAKPPSHLVKEWERWPELFNLPCDSRLAHKLTDLLAGQIAGKHGSFLFPRPFLAFKAKQTEVSDCTWDGNPFARTTVKMRPGFTVGELLHELAHAWLFHTAGDHGHGAGHVSALDALAETALRDHGHLLLDAFAP